MTRRIVIEVETELEPEVWMNTADDLLYPLYEGDLSPGVRAGVPHVSGFIDGPDVAYILYEAAFVASLLSKHGHRVTSLSLESEAETLPA